MGAENVDVPRLGYTVLCTWERGLETTLTDDPRRVWVGWVGLGCTDRAVAMGGRNR